MYSEVIEIRVQCQENNDLEDWGCIFSRKYSKNSSFRIIYRDIPMFFYISGDYIFGSIEDNNFNVYVSGIQSSTINTWNICSFDNPKRNMFSFIEEFMDALDEYLFIE